MGHWRRRRNSKSPENRNKSYVSQKSKQYRQSAGSALAATIRWVSGVVEGSPSQPKNETSRNSARSRDSQSARNQTVSRKCRGGHNHLGQWRRRRKSKSAENRNKSKVRQKSRQSIRQERVSQPEMPWWPQLGGTVVSSNEVQVSQEPKQVEIQPEVESLCRPETSQNPEVPWQLDKPMASSKKVQDRRKAKQIKSQKSGQ